MDWKIRKTKSHHGDTEARRKSGNYDFNFRFDILLCSFVSSVVKGFDQRKSAAKSFG